MTNTSYWSNSVKKKSYPKLLNEITVDAAVIGGGMAGMCIAYALKERGLKVAVLDSGEIGRGNTAGTTAKITMQHDLCYERITKEHGADKASLYALANTRAINKFEEIILKNQINCDFRRADSYVYATTDKGQEDIIKEFEASEKLNLGMEIAEETELPFPVLSALKMRNQAAFHPLKFLYALCDVFEGDGCRIFENTLVSEVTPEGEIIMDTGHIRAKSVVIATHFPIINVPGYYFLKMYQHRSHAIAFRHKPFSGLYVSAEEQGFSFRSQNTSGGALTIVVGADCKAGHAKGEHFYEILEKAAEDMYGDIEVLYRWSAQDCMTMDYMPYIGRYSVKTPNIYVATGFAKWGMTGSMVSGGIIADMITGVKNDFEELYNPSRFDPVSSIKEFVPQVGDIAVNLTAGLLKLASDKLSEIKNGEAGIVSLDNHRIGVYKDESGKKHAVNATCTHLGCALAWNGDELSWDCPCHGSRFSIDGNVIESPAVRPVDKLKINHEVLR